MVCDEFQFIHFAGFTYRGAISDKAMIEEELPDFKGLEHPFLPLTKDKGYQGYNPEGVYIFEKWNRQF